MKIKIKDIEFTYNRKAVLKELNFEFNKGEFIGLIGPNGSGKSTLLKTINGILSPEKGSILINEREIKHYSRNELARMMAYVPQGEINSFPTTVFDTILLGRKPYIKWKADKSDYDITSEIIDRLKLSKIAMKDINMLSGGQRQKVMIARALAQKSDIILLDEPTNSLDLRHQLEILNLIKKETERGILVITAIHDLNIAARYSDRLIILKEGQIFASGGPEILNTENIEAVYGVRVKIKEYAGKPFILTEEPLELFN
jgi:iron complex transport system ATP-binding protein